MDGLDSAGAKEFVEKSFDELKDLRLRVRRFEAEKIADRDLIVSLKAQLKDTKRDNLCLTDDLASYGSEIKRGNFIISQISQEYDAMKVSEKNLLEKLAEFERINGELHSSYTTDIRKNQDEFIKSIELSQVLELENTKLTGYVCQLERELTTLGATNQALSTRYDALVGENEQVVGILRSVQKFFVYAVTYCQSRSQETFSTLQQVIQSIDPYNTKNVSFLEHLTNMGRIRGGIGECSGIDGSYSGGGGGGGRNDEQCEFARHNLGAGGENNINNSSSNSKSSSNSNSNNSSSSSSNGNSKSSKSSINSNNSSRNIGGGRDKSRKDVDAKGELRARARTKVYKEYRDLFSHLRDLTTEMRSMNEMIGRLKSCNLSLKDVIHTYDATWSIIDDTSKMQTL